MIHAKDVNFFSGVPLKNTTLMPDPKNSPEVDVYHNTFCSVAPTRTQIETYTCTGYKADSMVDQCNAQLAKKFPEANVTWNKDSRDQTIAKTRLGDSCVLANNATTHDTHDTKTSKTTKSQACCGNACHEKSGWWGWW